MTVSADTLHRMHDAELELGGERLVLCADHSLFWPAGETLFVADTHFGKGGVFRRQGVSVPAGTTQSDLARLERGLRDTGAQRLVVLGDFLHAPPAGDEPWLTQFAEWRDRHDDIQIIVTRGNHDRVEQLPVDLAIDWQPGARLIGPFVCQHEPGDDARGPVLAGHIHPVVHLTAAGERTRCPAFWVRPGGIVLPAFCGFAGGGRVAPSAADRVFVIGEGEVIEARLA